MILCMCYKFIDTHNKVTTMIDSCRWFWCIYMCVNECVCVSADRCTLTHLVERCQFLFGCSFNRLCQATVEKRTKSFECVAFIHLSSMCIWLNNRTLFYDHASHSTIYINMVYKMIQLKVVNSN